MCNPNCYDGSNLNAKIPSIYIVSKKQVSGFSRVAAYFEQLHQVIVLPVNIATYGDGRIHLQKVGF